jgi:Leucine-rich repeat (LRR) protein
MASEARPRGLAHVGAENDDLPVESDTDSLLPIPHDSDDGTTTSGPDCPSFPTSDVASCPDESVAPITTLTGSDNIASSVHSSDIATTRSTSDDVSDAEEVAPAPLSLPNGRVIDAKNTLRLDIVPSLSSVDASLSSDADTIMVDTGTNSVSPDTNQLSGDLSGGFYKRIHGSDDESSSFQLPTEDMTHLPRKLLPAIDIVAQQKEFEMYTTDVISDRQDNELTEEMVSAEVLYGSDGNPLPLPMQVVEGEAANSEGSSHLANDPSARSTAPDEGTNFANSEQSDGQKRQRGIQKRWIQRGLLVALALALVAALLGTICGNADCSFGNSPRTTPMADDQIANLSNASTPTTSPVAALPSSSPMSSSSSSSSPIEQVVDYINSITLTGQTFTTDVAALDSASPEAKALLSLLVNIQINLVPNTASSRFRWLQMYALSTLLAQLPFFTYVGHECDWDGVKCAFIDLGDPLGRQKVVVQLNFSSFGVNGPLSMDLGLLSNLEHVDLSSNLCSGTLPTSLDRWTNLTFFDISSSLLVGALPSAIGLWTKLRHFNMNGNSLTGSLPDFLEQWSNVEIIDVRSNAMSGPLPDSIGQWTSLTVFDIGKNKFSGSLPASIEQWSNLRWFDANDNSLTGFLPTSLGQWTNVTHIDLFDNDLSGPLPETVGQWTALEYFDAKLNSLNGSLPVTVGGWSRLVHLNLNSNALGGTLPDSIGQWTNLVFVSLENNKFSGTVPQSVINWSHLRQAYLRLNNLSGSIPGKVCDAFNATLVFLWADCVSKIVCECCTTCW